MDERLKTEMIMYKFITYNFGSRYRFGITFELSDLRDVYLGDQLRGSICYWFYGKSIGDMAYGVPLSGEGLWEIERILKNSSSRCEPCSFLNADSQSILDVMNQDIENETNDIIVENPFGFIGTFDFWWETHRISWQLDIMSEHLLLYFENESQARIIWALLSEDKERYIYQGDFFLEKGEFDTILEKARSWLQQEYEKEVARDHPIN
jgi:hypothetical protein